MSQARWKLQGSSRLKPGQEISFRRLDEVVQIHTKNNDVFQLNNSLDHIESILDPKEFFRANRQFLVAYHAIKQVQHYYDRKLLIELNHPNAEPVIVSKAKASAFLKWVEDH